MSQRLVIAPSILSADFARLGDELRAVEAAGADLIHVDVMDGRFVPNLTIGPLVVEAARRATSLPLDVHLMILEPDRLIPAFVRAGASTITVHAEACTHLHRTVAQVRDEGVRVGVALNPATPLGAVEEILGDVDQVLLMSVNPGFGGQSFIPATLGRIARLRAMLDVRGLSSVDVEVDGGVNADTARAVRAQGANVLVAGHAVFRAADYASAIAALRA